MYFQATTKHGFRFYDESGKILNKYVEDFDEYANGMDGIRLARPKSSKGKPHAIRVDSQRIWLQFLAPASLSEAGSLILPFIRDISKILGVEEYSRFGLRVEYYASAQLNTPEIADIARKALGSAFHSDLDAIQERVEFVASYRGMSKGLGTIVIFRSMRITRPPKELADYPADGLLFDVDSYVNDVDGLSGLPQFIGTALENVSTRLKTNAKNLFEV